MTQPKPTKKENLKMKIAKIIGHIKDRTLTINDEEDQVILTASSLIRFLKAIQDEL